MRRLPPCTTCGRKLNQRTQPGVTMRIEFTAVAGRPEIGWCGEHYRDGIAATASGQPDDATNPVLVKATAEGRAIYLRRRQPSDSNKSPNPAPGGDRSGLENER